MDILLWRHAEAEIGEPDEGRALTPKGVRQAQKMAQWLERNLPSRCRILVSPTVRTLQTAQALERKFRICPEIAPGATPEALLAAANWPDGKEPVLLVGHQPSFGQAAALLLCGSTQDWTIRKGNIWWIAQRERDGSSDNYLKAVVAPDLVMK
ncbi:phosphohistidine phosphatase SixA [Noviherbaspirillum sedimenti]|uniref:Phosphohistidine phosphatase SixA n=1 Tax=Noviherbaspirillum sedimenti TaxID=2320865 RepID=A0A3A3G0I1_9BURK|nr:phosphohistidine phosphatase SixA [Noviherbaspirillum sedimenti]RJG01943.1 phosphohistidine phosphatase SixA [Noviherbaspirillum sedimenti]